MLKSFLVIISVLLLIWGSSFYPETENSFKEIREYVNNQLLENEIVE